SGYSIPAVDMSKRDDSKQRPALGPEHLARLLELISPDRAQAERGYTRLCDKLTGFFTMKGISDPMSAADETIDRAMLNIAAGAVVPDVEKSCFGIARNVARERYRLIQREGLAFQGYQNEMNNFSAESIERIYAVLKPCFEALSVDEREL